MSTEPANIPNAEPEEPEVFYCTSCNVDLHHPDDCHWIHDYCYCVDCTIVCFECDSYIPRCDTYRVRGRSGTVSMCVPCFENSAFECENCGEAFFNSYLSQSVCDDLLCFPCASEREEESPSHIGDYHSRTRRAETHAIHSPWSLSHGRRLFGVELEVEARTGTEHRALNDYAGEILTAVRDWADTPRRLWCEHDGSLSNGFEIITAPMGLDLQRELWARVLSLGTMKHFKSHDTSTCGLHVHVSRQGLTQMQIAKAIVFLNDDRTEGLVRCVARRYGGGYCQKRDNVKLSRHISHDINRYTMLNTLPSSTVEFRLFRGSLRLETVLGCIEFANAVLDWCRDVSAQDLTVPSFLAWIHDANNRADTANLRALLNRRAPAMSGAIARVLSLYQRPAAPAIAPVSFLTTPEE